MTIPEHVPYTLAPLPLDCLEEVHAFWLRHQPLHPVSAVMLRERLWLAPGTDEALCLAARDSAGALAGFAVGTAYQGDFANFSGVRWLGVDPAHLSGGVVALLLGELEARLAARGVTHLRLYGTPPYYFRPGVDTRETALISVLLDLGWTNEATAFNMSADLKVWRSPGEAAIYGADARGYRVRRAVPEDRDAFAAYMSAHWTPGWRAESLQALSADPVTLFLAIHEGAAGEEEIVGFAAYEVSQCRGGFGPTGVTPEHRGARLGQRTLWACLDDLQRRGEPVCEIGWVGPVPFYFRSAGAILGPSYWWMSKTVGAPAQK